MSWIAIWIKDFTILVEMRLTSQSIASAMESKGQPILGCLGTMELQTHQALFEQEGVSISIREKCMLEAVTHRLI
jgi:hypothetical protein